MSNSSVTLPHKFQPRKYQEKILQALDSGCKRAVIVWHRRSGKDKVLINLIIKKAFERVGIYYYFFPTYSQGEKIIWDGVDKDGFKFLDHIPQEVIGDKNDTKKRVRFVNGSILQIIGTDNIDSIVGTNPIGCVFSEYSIQDPRAWDFIRPILAENGGWAVFAYTPRGLNHGWKLLQQARTEPNWFHEVLTVDDTEAISKEVLEEEERQMPPDLFQQEYYCKFLDGASQFFRRIKENTWAGTLNVEDWKTYQLGVDLAKFQDWTVITPFDRHTFQAGTQERFQRMDYVLQKSRIESASYRFNKARLILDSTGVGEPIFDDLTGKGLPVTPYHFTENTRNDLLNNLRILLEQDRIKIPDDEVLINELRSFQYELIGERGKTRIRVPGGVHDDCVMSLALAVWDIGQPLGRQEENQEVKVYTQDFS